MLTEELGGVMRVASGCACSGPSNPIASGRRQPGATIQPRSPLEGNGTSQKFSLCANICSPIVERMSSHAAGERDDAGESASTGQGSASDGGAVAADDECAGGPFGLLEFPAGAHATDVVRALRLLARDGVRDLDDESLLGLFDAAELVDRYFSSVRFQVLAELDARDLCDRRFGHRVGTQAGWRHGADSRRIGRDLKCAKILRRHLPDIGGALSRGEVSVDRARELARHMNDRNAAPLSEMQPALLAMLQSRSGFAQFARDVEQITRLADPDGVEPPTPRDHGSMELSGDKLTATFEVYGPRAGGAAQRLNAEADRLFKQISAEHERCPDVEVPPRSELVAQAFLNLVEHGSAHRYSGAQQPGADMTIVLDVDPDSLAHLFHDGTLLPGKDSGTHRCTHKSPSERADRANRGGGSDRGDQQLHRSDGVCGCGSRSGAPVIDWSSRAHDLSGAPLRYSSRDWEMLTCDATYTWIIKGADGHPIACKSGERTASTEQRRALKYRDGRCVMPGCDAPDSWCDAHHVRHHADDGPTEVPNMALLCRRHHGVIHRSGWSMTANSVPQMGEGFFIITSPTGQRLHTQHARGPGHLRAVPA